MSELSPVERETLSSIRAAGSLAALAAVFDADDEHDAYFEAKEAWRRLRGRELDPYDPGTGLPGSTVTVEDRVFHVHGVTHADTDAERESLREHVRGFLDAGHAVYCEQGVRGLYFEDFGGACAMDDYRWALRECERRGVESHVDGDPFDSLAEDVDDLASQFREAAFSLVDASGDRFGERFERALGSVASAFFTSRADHATGSNFASFRLRERAARDPTLLWKLQRYYERTFLPQPLEREWLRRHDPGLELVTHARNERMADYAVAHATEPGDVHLVVGAAHQPGVRYYLERHRDGDRDAAGFEPVLE